MPANSGVSAAAGVSSRIEPGGDSLRANGTHVLRITSYNVCYTKLLRAALERRFQPVLVEEPSVEDTIAIPRKRGAVARTDALQEDRSPACVEQPNRLIGSESQQRALFAGELDLVQPLPPAPLRPRYRRASAARNNFV